MALNTTDRAAALVRAKERSDNADTDENDAFLGDLLDASAGTDEAGTTHYRPYLVAAQALDTATMRLESAPAAEFRSVAENIEALLRLQAAEDARLNLAIPQGWTPEDVRGTRDARPRIAAYLQNEPTF